MSYFRHSKITRGMCFLSENASQSARKGAFAVSVLQ